MKAWKDYENSSDTTFDYISLEAGPLVATGVPSMQTAEIDYSVKNEGTLVLATPKAAAITPLNEAGGTYSIPASAVLFNPSLFEYINPGQTKYGKWSVMVPAGQPVGTYTGTIQVWDDSDDSGSQNGAEPFDTVDVEVRVLGKKVLAITPAPLDLNFVPPGQTVNGDFLITNTGNVDITGGAEVIKAIVSQLNPLSAGPAAITQVEILPAPDITNSLLIGESVTAIASVTVPSNQTSGPYEGMQKIYIDKGSPGDGIHDSATEEYATFTLKLTVGQKKLSISPTTLDMGNLDPLANNSLSCTVKNETSISLSSVKFYKLELISGAHSIPTTAYSFSPAGPFTISSNGSKSVTASLTVPMGQPAGTYEGLLTVFEDDSGNGIPDGFEASATFILRVVVNPVPRLTFTPDTIDLGAIDAGSSSPEFTVEYLNSGNTDLSALSWNIGALAINDGGGETITDISFSGPDPSALATGTSGTAVLKVGPIPAGQKSGIYTGSIEALYDTTMSFIPPAMLYLTVEVIGGTVGPDLASGSAYQEVATLTWTPAGATWIMSAWVSLDPVASAAIRLLEVDADGNQVWRGIEIDSGGGLTASGTTGSGVVMSNRASNPPMTWHRVYFSFTGPDVTVASNTYIVLQNTTENTVASQSVWFDGVQLEKAGPDQTRPSPYTAGNILVSPNRRPSLDGKYRYNEW